jgi:hypothetical protein
MTLAESMLGILEMRREMKAAGSDERACDAAVERSLREVWPFTREWKYLCNACDDTGLQLTLEQTTVYGTREVWIGRPCQCSLGNRFRPKAASEQDFTQAGKTPKPQKQFSRFSR